MSRMFRSAAFALALAATPAAFAQERGDQSPFDLARALRDGDQPDLALEYLDELAKTAAPNWQMELPVERAKTRIRLAAPETDEVKRDILVNEAKAELDQFLKAHASHPRAAEAAMSLANVASLQGKSQLSRAGRIPDIAGQKAAGALARPFFTDASVKFQTAAAALENMAKTADTPNLKRDKTRELYQTILDQGINRYLLGESYIGVEGQADIKARYDAYSGAQDTFNKLGDRDVNHPLCWVARAWAGECFYPKSEATKAEAAFAKIRLDAAKNPNGPGVAGVRQARFFEIRDQWIQAGKKNAAPIYSKVRGLCEAWLADYRTFRITNETYAVTFYSATTKLDEAKLGVKYDEKTKKVEVNPNVLPLLKDADKDFRKLGDTENEYTARANRIRPEVIRLLVGNADKKPEQLLTFEECHLTTLVQLDKYQQLSRDEKATPEQKKAQLGVVIALLEREKQLPVPKDSLRDSLNSQVMLVYTYRVADEPYRAAILGEHLAKSGKGPTAAKSGLNAMLAYLESARKADPADVASQQADTAKAMAVAMHLDREIPDDASTDEVRFLGARLLVQNARYIEAFNLLNRITARYANITQARLFQGGIAYELLRPRGPNANPVKFALPLEAQKLALFKMATKDLGGVPVANPASPPAVAIDYCRVQIQLAQLYLASGADNYPMAEKIGHEVAAIIPTLATLPKDEKESLPMEAEIVRINSLFGQAMPLYQQKKYKESADRYQGTINVIEKVGPASKPNQSPAVANVAKTLDATRINKVVIPALNSRVGEGNLDAAGKLLDMLSKFGGDQNQTVNAVFQVVMATKPQIEAMKKDNKADEAKKVSENLAALASRISGGNAQLTTVQLLDLGKIFKELGDFEKASALLLRIPAPANAAFLKAEPQKPPESEPVDAPAEKKSKDDAVAAWTADKAATPYYRVAQLELLRTYRLGDRLPKAEELVLAVMGKDRKEGWAARFPEFRRETFLYLEAKAAGTANLPEAQKLWLEAQKGWSEYSGEVRSIITRPIPANAKEEDVAKIRQQKELAKPLYFDLTAEMLRCTARLQLHLLAAKKPELDKGLNNIAKQIADIGKNNPDLSDDIKAKYLKLLDDVPQLKELYKANGGLWAPPPK